MNTILLTIILLLQSDGFGEGLTGTVVVELKNGNLLEGEFVEKDGDAIVLSIEGGELRLELRQVKRVFGERTEHVVSDEENAGVREDARARTSEHVIEIDTNRQLRLAVPKSWRKESETEEKTAFHEKATDIRFCVEKLTTAQSLWSLTSRQKAELKQRSRMRLHGERFGNVWQNVQTWEIDFEYALDGTVVRERKLFLEFGAAKQVLTLSAPPKEFTAASESFRRLVASMSMKEEASPDGGGTSHGSGDSSAEPERSESSSSETSVERREVETESVGLLNGLGSVERQGDAFSGE